MATNNTTGWAGWVYFAGILLVIQGVVQALLGASELVKKQVFFVLHNQVITTNYFITAGWFDLIVGILLVAAGFSLMHGSFWARVVGVVVAGLSLMLCLVFLPIYPIWSILAGIINAYIIYALVVHGNEVAN